MRIWLMEEDVNVYEHITLANGSHENWIEFSDMHYKQSLKEIWKPLKIKLIEHGGKLKRGDIPYLSPGMPVLTQKAVEILRDFLEGNAEILPLDYNLQEVYMVNVINRIDAIDYDKANVIIPDGKRILRVIKYSFKLDVVRNQHIFKVLNQLWGNVFVSDEFRNRVLESGLKGFKFIDVWDSET